MPLIPCHYQPKLVFSVSGISQTKQNFSSSLQICHSVINSQLSLDHQLYAIDLVIDGRHSITCPSAVKPTFVFDLFIHLHTNTFHNPLFVRSPSHCCRGHHHRVVEQQETHIGGDSTYAIGDYQGW